MQVELICADAFDPQLGLVAHGEVDHVVGDPPYSGKVHRGHRSTRKGAGGVRAEQDLGFEALTPAVRRRTAEAIAAVVRRWVVLFSDLEGAGAWCDELRAAGLEPVQVGVWLKSNPTPQLTGTRPASPGEALVVAHAMNGRRPMAKRWNGGGRALSYRGPSERGSRRRGVPRHPTQKPLWLMEALLRELTDPGERVADPFAGSGTTLVAAARMGRAARGWERAERWAAVGRRRLATVRPQLELAVPRAGVVGVQLGLEGE
ncbi:MAG: DNA methyltransferase [Nannocystaceae bacterium]